MEVIFTLAKLTKERNRIMDRLTLNSNSSFRNCPIQCNLVNLSRFRRMKLKYLKEHRQVQYTNLLLSGKYNDYIQEFDDEMNGII